MTGGGPFDKVIGGWQWNVIFNGSTGQHFSVVGQTNSNQTQIANLVGDPFANVPAGDFINLSAFTAPVTSDPHTICVNNFAGKQVCYGNSGRNRFTGPGYFRTDMSIFKNTKIGERVNLQIGLEGYNLFNQDNALVPQNSVGATGNFVNTILPPRIVQYRAKVIF